VTVAVIHASSWYWYFGRATGFVALILLTAVIVLGVLGPLRVTTDAWPRFAIRTVHRDVSLLALLLIVIHIAVSLLDGYVHIPVSAAVLPFGSGYEPFWMGLGALAFDLLIAIILTSLMRRRLGYGTWRFVHWFTYICWPIAVAHGLGSGSDSTSAWALGLTFACIAVVAAAVAMRVQGGSAAKTLEA
jgi:methionine sulfoxide reductase heme-binding subunit